MVWTCDVDDSTDDTKDTKENATHQNGGKMARTKTQNQMDGPN